jgi:hypothetical protein
MEAGDEEDEVGYRLGEWEDRARGRLIERLNVLEILHRFEDDELVVAAEDESRVDDLLAEVAATPDDGGSAEDDGGAGEVGTAAAAGELSYEDERDWVTEAVRLLADAARRLREDPTDMYADADVAEASAAVFTVDMFYGADAETWAAVGRVTRRLLSALGADEALEDEIRSQAAVLDKLLDPLIREPSTWRRTGGPSSGSGETTLPAAPAVVPAPSAPSAPSASPAPPGSSVPAAGGEAMEVRAGGAPVDLTGVPVVGGDPVEVRAGGEAVGAGGAAGGETLEAASAGVGGDAGEEETGAAGDERFGPETVYELPEWLPEQRAQLGIMFDNANIAYEWEGDDLVVPADREVEVESLFEQVSALFGDDDGDEEGETRYRAIEEMFAAVDRLANDPSDGHRATDAVDRIKAAIGPPPFGLDEVAWFHIMTQARALSESIGADRDESVIFDEATALRDLLRAIV